MSLRLVFSATGGHLLGGGPGAAIAAAAAVSTAFTGSRLRSKVRGSGRQLAAAAAEDALSYSLVLTAAAALR
jgi:gas vesicle protein